MVGARGQCQLHPAGVAGSAPAVSTQTGSWEETAGSAADGKAHLARVRGA